MKTTYTVFHPNGTVGHGDIDWPEAPDYALMHPVIERIVGKPMEHVTVLYKDARADMFVNENGHAKGLERNERATAIYRAASVRRGMKSEELPFIVGVAVVFDRVVWR